MSDKTFDLTIDHRLTLQLVIEQTKGNFSLVRIAHDMRQRLGIDAAEAKRIALRTDDRGQVLWTASKARNKKIKFSPFELTVIKRCLTDLSKAKALTVLHVGVVTLFAPELGDSDTPPAFR